MSKKQRKFVGLFVSFTSLFFMAIYALYIGYLSGTEVGTFTVQEFDGNVSSFGNYIATNRETVRYIAGPIPIRSTMNPLRATMRIDQTSIRQGLPQLESRVRLMDEKGRVVWETKSIQKIDANESTIRVAFDAFTVGEEGNYYFAADFDDRRTYKATITRGTVSLRKNVATANYLIFIVAGILAFMGFILMLSGIGSKS